MKPTLFATGDEFAPGSRNTTTRRRNCGLEGASDRWLDPSWSVDMWGLRVESTHGGRIENVRARPSDSAEHTQSGRRPRWWFRGGGGRPFMHRRADVVRSAIGLAVLIICGALVHGRLLTSAESAVLLFVNGWPEWLYRPMWFLQIAGVIVAAPVVAAGATVLRRYRLAVALVAAAGLEILLGTGGEMGGERQPPGG